MERQNRGVGFDKCRIVWGYCYLERKGVYFMKFISWRKTNRVAKTHRVFCRHFLSLFFIHNRFIFIQHKRNTVLLYQRLHYFF